METVEIKQSKMQTKPSLLNTNYRSEKSEHGYTLDVLKSAIQKYVRRGNYEKALYFAREFESFSYEPTRGETIRTNFIHRLMIIYLEDIGPANIGIWKSLQDNIDCLLTNRKDYKGYPVDSRYFLAKKKEDDLCVSRIMRLMCNSAHSRECSFYRTTYYHYHSFVEKKKDYIKSNYDWIDKVVEIRKLENDTQTQTGDTQTIDERENNNLSNIKVKGKIDILKDYPDIVKNFIYTLTLRHPSCIYWAFKLQEKDTTTVAYFSRKKKVEYLIFYIIDLYYPELKNYTTIGRAWCDELKNLKEKWLTWMVPLITIVKSLNISTNCFENDEVKDDEVKDDEVKDDEVKDEKEDRKEEDYRRMKDTLEERVEEEEKVQIDEYVYDMHTLAGKRIGRSHSYFALVSSKVENPDPNITSICESVYYLSKYYDEYNTINNKFPSNMQAREKDRYPLLVRAQLLTSNAKCDTYYATDKDSCCVFVKGPYIVEEQATDTLRILEFKRHLPGLNCYNARIEWLLPMLGNISSNSSPQPMGTRTRCKPNTLYPFVICDDLCGVEYLEDGIPICFKSSKLWKKTEVVDWSKLDFHVDPKTLPDRLYIQYLLAVIFKYICGTGDLADRNFVVSNDRVYTVDEDSIGRSFDLGNSIRGREKLDRIISKLKEEKEEIEGYLKTWLEVIDKDSVYLGYVLREHLPFIRSRLYSIQNLDCFINLLK